MRTSAYKRIMLIIKHPDHLPKYVFEPRAKNWDDAEKDCKERGGDLAFIRTEQENSEIWDGFKSRYSLIIQNFI